MAAAKYHLGDRVALTASLFMVALCLGIVLVFLMFAPPPAHGVAPMSVSEQWLATCSHSPRREECYLYATGFTHALYIWRELAPLTARVCLPETWDNELAVGPPTRSCANIPLLAFHMRRWLRTPRRTHAHKDRLN